MSRETVTKDIEGVEYRITQLGAKTGRRVLAHLVRILGRAADDKVGEMLDALTDAEVDFLCDTFAPTTRIVLEGDRELDLKAQFDDHFVGAYGRMVQWLWACLEVNFADFLGGLNLQDLLDKANPAKSLKTTAKPSSPSSTRATAA